MATGADIAKAYVQIIPSADGIQGKLTEMMGGEAEKAGNKAGGKLGAAFGKGLAGAAVGLAASATAMTVGFVNATGQVAELGDHIDKMSQKMGISAEAYQEWDAILQHSGTSIDSMQRGMMTLSKAAESGSDAFEALGISQEQIASMSQEELFSATITALQGMEEGTERTALASQLLGGSAKELGALLNTSAEDTEAMRQKVHELGGVMSNDSVKAAAAYKDSMQDMKTALTGAKNSIMVEFMPAVTSVMDGLTKLFSGDSTGIQQVKIGISTFIKHISDAVPQIFQMGSEIILSLAQAIVANLPELLNSAAEMIMTIGMGLVEQLPLIIQTGMDVLMALADGIIANLPIIIPAVVDVVIQIVDSLIDNIDMLVDASIAIIMALAEGLINALPRLIQKAPEIVGKLVDAVVRNAPKLLTAAWELIKTLASGIVQNLGQIFDKGKEIVQKVISGVGQAIRGLWSAGLDIVKGIWKGISDGFGWIKDRITGWVGDLLGFFKRILKIGSPSKVFADEVGKWMALGMGEGFVDEMGSVEDMMQDSIPTAFDLLGKPGFSATARGANAYNYGGVTIQILGREKDAEQLAIELQNALVRRAAVWA